MWRWQTRFRFLENCVVYRALFRQVQMGRSVAYRKCIVRNRDNPELRLCHVSGIDLSTRYHMPQE